jgi:hypothetical protein
MQPKPRGPKRIESLKAATFLTLSIRAGPALFDGKEYLTINFYFYQENVDSHSAKKDEPKADGARRVEKVF